ncbi:MAG: endonuclease domain-containing protein [candidate division Zixibacteria bacterium]|nr:endonuclease domain-containing protein [candidate division Zixibacteria bacterium]
MKRRSSDELKTQRRIFRKEPTNAENILWKQLSNRQLNGFKFRRQHPLSGRFIADFYCAEKKLVIEIDGSIHDHQKEIDKEREDYISSSGIEVIRFKNNDVEDRLEFVIDKILEKISD